MFAPAPSTNMPSYWSANFADVLAVRFMPLIICFALDGQGNVLVAKSSV
jgi:hypothetical protein